MYVKTSNQFVKKFPYTLNDLRKDNPNVSFPKNISDDQLAEWGIQRVTIAPIIDVPAGKVAVHNDEPDYEGIEWVLNWTVRDYNEGELDGLSEIARMDRNAKLAECDWTQLVDAPLNDAKKAEWGVYRRALRNISAQDGFPYDIDWPTAP